MKINELNNTVIFHDLLSLMNQFNKIHHAYLDDFKYFYTMLIVYNQLFIYDKQYRLLHIICDPLKQLLDKKATIFVFTLDFKNKICKLENIHYSAIIFNLSFDYGSLKQLKIIENEQRKQQIIKYIKRKKIFEDDINYLFFIQRNFKQFTETINLLKYITTQNIWLFKIKQFFKNLWKTLQ